MKSLYQYSDYRSYLKDLIEFRREKGLPVSNRWFSQKMGINSNAWLTYILQGKRNLNSDNIRKLVSILKFNVTESRYFEALVQFNQAKTIDARNSYYRSLEAIRSTTATIIITSDQYEFYSVWYHSVVRSIIDMYPEFDDYEKLGAMITPPITASEARKSVALLERLGLISKLENGKYHICDKAIVSGPHEKTLAVENYQRETMKFAQESLDRFGKSERDISTMTLGISEKAKFAIQKLLEDTRRRITEIASEDTESDRVYQLNIQFFPFSRQIPARKKDVEQ